MIVGFLSHLVLGFLDRLFSSIRLHNTILPPPSPGLSFYKQVYQVVVSFSLDVVGGDPVALQDPGIQLRERRNARSGIETGAQGNALSLLQAF